MRPWRYWSPEQYTGHLSEIDPGLRELYSSASVDTYMIVHYDFDDLDWQDWTQFDWTAQRDTFFHVDDFAGLDGGDYGYLVPITGAKSIWCGARPGTDEYMCRWYYAPGYGNNWDQSLVTSEIHYDGTLILSYNGVFDSENAWDFTHIEYDAGEGDWIEVYRWAGHGVVAAVSHEILTTKASTKLRFHFTSDGAWSDEAGGNTDGACVIDDIVISDNSGVLYTEDFEAWDVGAKSDPGSIWYATTERAFGIYSGLWMGLQDRDPCNNNFTTQIVFFVGSTDPSSEYPGLFNTPNYDSDYLCQYELVISPVIDLSKFTTGNNEVQDGDIPGDQLEDLGGVLLNFTVYRDLPADNFVYYVWHVRNVDEFGCPGVWSDFNLVYYGPDKKYNTHSLKIGDLVDATGKIQVALGVMDLVCEIWDPLLTEHNPTPWFDNVSVVGYSTAGPQWSYRALDIFQDNFPEDEFDIESFVRADQADDKAMTIDPFFRPGDSVVVTCASALGGGIREGGVTGGGEVYMHVRCTDISGWLGKPNLYGSQLEGSYGIYVSDDGSEWTVIQCDTAKFCGDNPIPDQWSVDLNDSLLTRGYMVEYYFSAADVAGDVTTLPDGGGGPGAGSSLTSGPAKVYEFTCLPTGRGDILYVDDFDGRGCHEGIAQVYFDKTFVNIMYSDMWPDRYDVNAPSAMVGNGLGSRATLNQMLYNDIERSGYRIIIWDSGDLDVGTIGDGNPAYEKTDDCSLLINWLSQSGNDVGLLVCGDNIAYDLAHNLGSVPAIMLMSSWCGVNHVNGSYFDMTGGFVAGGVVNPLVTGAGSGIFWNSGDPYQFYLDGGCPLLSDFDVLEKTADGVEALMYPDYDGSSYVAGIQSSQMNSTGNYARTMWFGSSFMNIRDTDTQFPLIRLKLLYYILEWFYGTPFPVPMGGEIPGAYRLAQNYPNPFNPTTTIHFDIKKKGQVSLRIYNVAGQLVRTLVDGELEAGSYSKDWKGLNNGGSKVASGVYFYRLEAGEFESVKKMVLLR